MSGATSGQQGFQQPSYQTSYGVPMNQQAQQPFQGWYSQPQQQPQQQMPTQGPGTSYGNAAMPSGGGKSSMGSMMPMYGMGGINPLMGYGAPNYGASNYGSGVMMGGNPLARDPGAGIYGGSPDMGGGNPLARDPAGSTMAPWMTHPTQPTTAGYSGQQTAMANNPMNNMQYAQNAFLGGMPNAGQILDNRYQQAYGPGGYAGPWTANG